MIARAIRNFLEAARPSVTYQIQVGKIPKLKKGERLVFRLPEHTPTSRMEAIADALDKIQKEDITSFVVTNDIYIEIVHDPITVKKKVKKNERNSKKRRAKNR